MSKTLFLARASFMALAIVALGASLTYARGGGGHGGGGGGGHWGGGGGHYGSFHASAPSYRANAGQFAHAGNFNRGFASNAGAWNHHGNWNGQNGNWYGRNNWNNYYARGGWGGWGSGGYWPWYAALGWGWGYPYGYGYDYGYYPYDSGYYYTYAPTYYGEADAAVNPGLAAASQVPPPPEVAQASEDQQQAGSEGLQYYSEARAAFLQGDYRNALRLASHAGVESPQNSKVHELISLALFASGNYPAAASEAHAAMALGPIADWADLFGYYNNLDTYTAQLRALEKAATGNPKSAADHFLLGYQYLMTGVRNEAKAQLAEDAKLTPHDKLAGHYLRQLESKSPLTPPQMAARPQAAPQ